MKARDGPKYFAGERLTIADFVIVSHYLCYAFNDFNKKPIVDQARAFVEETPIVCAYVDRVKEAIASYLAIRPGSLV